MPDATPWFSGIGHSSREELERNEAVFYGSDEWRLGPREAILVCIDLHTSIVLQIGEDTINGLRSPSITTR